MNLIKCLTMKLHQQPVFIDGIVNSTEVAVHSKTNFVKAVQNQLLFRKTINAVRQLMLQDRHATYREIETTLGISGTSIHSILHEHLTVKKFFRVGYHTICQSIKKNQLIRVTKVLRQLIQKHAKVYRSQWRIF